jgi:hypothetical protein
VSSYATLKLNTYAQAVADWQKAPINATSHLDISFKPCGFAL